MIATTVLTVINILGVGAGFLIPSAFVSDNSSIADTKNDFFTLLLVEAIITTILVSPVFFMFREKPPTPPRFYKIRNIFYILISFAAEIKKHSFKVSLHKVFKNKTFILLFITFSFVMGNYNCLATIVDLLIKPFGFDEVFLFYFFCLFFRVIVEY